MKHLIMKRDTAFILLLTSLFAILSAYFMQYFFKLPACTLCWWQRYVYFEVIIFAGLALFYQRFLYLAFLGFFTEIALAFYHVGVEKKIFVFNSGCTTNFSTAKTQEELLKIIQNAASVRCDEVLGEFLGISIAGWNVIYLLGILIYICYKCCRKNLK